MGSEDPRVKASVDFINSLKLTPAEEIIAQTLSNGFVNLWTDCLEPTALALEVIGSKDPKMDALRVSQAALAITLKMITVVNESK